MSYDNETAQMYAGLGLDAFQRRNRELLASFDGAQTARALVAWTRLHKLDDLRDHIATSEPQIEFWAAHLEKGFLNLLDSGKIQSEAPITELGEKDLAAMRKRTEIYPSGVTPAAVAKPLSAQERLEAEVIADFNSLPSDKMRQKRNASKAYDETFIRLANENRLESRITHSGIAGA